MTIMHTVAANWKAARPIVFSMAIGLLLGPLISNQMGWQVTSGAARIQAHAAVTDARALVCTALARTEVAEPAKLDWSLRNDLAKKWSIMPGETTADSDVVSSCSNKLAS